MGPTDDRSYSFLAKTFDAPGLDPSEFVAVMQDTVMPAWRELHARHLIASVQFLHKTGDIDLFTSRSPARDWRYFALLQIADGANVNRVADAETAGGIRVDTLAERDVQYLSNEILERPAGAGTALPLPSPHCSSPPANQTAGIEYIQIPQAHWHEYRQFMHDIMGPIGAHMVAKGDSYQIQIMERTQVMHRSDSLPEWNRIHILWGDFDDAENGFFERARQVAQQVFRPGFNVQGALSSTNHYRVKPRMSQNRLLAPLCLGNGLDQR